MTGGEFISPALWLLDKIMLWWSHKPKLLPYITHWESNVSTSGIDIRLRLGMQNKSMLPNTVENVLLIARGSDSLRFQPSQWENSVIQNNIVLTDVYSGEHYRPLMHLSQNIAGRSDGFGWLLFVIGKNYVSEAWQQGWYVKIWDQDGKSYESTRERDCYLKECPSKSPETK